MLEPQGIRIKDWVARSTETSAYFHDSVEKYGDYRATVEETYRSRIWLDKGDALMADVLREYGCMHSSKCCDAEYKIYAIETFFKRDSRKFDFKDSLESSNRFPPKCML